MRITNLTVHRVNLPLDLPYRWSQGYYFGASKGIVEVHTDEGIVGLGELPAVELSSLVEEELTPRLLGANPLNLDDCIRRTVPDQGALRNTHDLSRLRAFGGIEIALWDVKGKALGVPVHVLLGGAARTEVAFSEYFALRPSNGDLAGQDTPAEVARYCARMREEHGSTVFEGKVGIGDLAAELELVREVRAAIGDDAVLRLDANHGWSLSTARRALRGFEPYEIANIEDPIDDFRDMAKLRQHSEIPFSSHLPDIRLAVDCGTPDAIVLNLMALGGIRETVKFIAACEAFGIDFWFYSGDAGIGTAAYVQVSAAVAHVRKPHQSLLRWYADDVVAGGPLRPHDNMLPVPSGPGLGVSIDEVALKRCQERFEREGVVRQQGVPGELNYPRVPLE